MCSTLPVRLYIVSFLDCRSCSPNPAIARTLVSRWLWWWEPQLLLVSGCCSKPSPEKCGESVKIISLRYVCSQFWCCTLIGAYDFLVPPACTQYFHLRQWKLQGKSCSLGDDDPFLKHLQPTIFVINRVPHELQSQEFRKWNVHTSSIRHHRLMPLETWWPRSSFCCLFWASWFLKVRIPRCRWCPLDAVGRLDS